MKRSTFEWFTTRTYIGFTKSVVTQPPTSVFILLYTVSGCLWFHPFYFPVGTEFRDKVYLYSSWFWSFNPHLWEILKFYNIPEITNQVGIKTATVSFIRRCVNRCATDWLVEIVIASQVSPAQGVPRYIFFISIGTSFIKIHTAVLAWKHDKHPNKYTYTI